MSTEHQQYSTENQADKIREYAARRNIEIVRTYADEGKSGLRIDGRQARRCPPSSRASNARWPANTAANSSPRCSPASAA